MKRYLCAIFIISFVFSSCMVLDRKPTIYYNEEELSLEDITQMRQTFEEPELSEQNYENLVPYSDKNVEIRVYWVKNGNVWHTSPECGYFNDDVEIIFGSEEDAIQCGKQRACRICGKNN